MLPPDPENYRRWHGEGGRRFIWQRDRRQHLCPHHHHHQQQWTLHTFHVPREANGPMERRWGQSYGEGGWWGGHVRLDWVREKERMKRMGVFRLWFPNEAWRTQTHNSVTMKCHLFRRKKVKYTWETPALSPRSLLSCGLELTWNQPGPRQTMKHLWGPQTFRVTRQHQVQTSLCKGDLPRLGFLAPHSVDHSWISECQPSLSWLPHCTLQLSNTLAPGLCGQLLTCCMKYPDMQVKEVTTQTHTGLNMRTRAGVRFDKRM